MIKLKVDKVVEQQEIEIPTPYYVKYHFPETETTIAYKFLEDSVTTIIKDSFKPESSYRFNIDKNPIFSYYRDYLENSTYKSSEEEWYKMYEEAIDFIEKNFEPKIGE